MIATVTFKNYSVVKIIGNDLYSCNQRLRVKTAVEYFDLLFTVHFTFVCGCNLCISFLCRQKGANALRMDAFLTKNIVDILWASGTRLAAQNGSAIFLT